MNEGIVYVFTNLPMRGMVKIGKTGREIETASTTSTQQRFPFRLSELMPRGWRTWTRLRKPSETGLIPLISAGYGLSILEGSDVERLASWMVGFQWEELVNTGHELAVGFGTPQ